MTPITLAPEEDGYTWQAPEESRRLAHEGGAGAYGPWYINGARLVTVRWTCDADEYLYLRGKYTEHVNEGHAPFEMDLILEEAGDPVTHWVTILPGSFGLTGQQGDAYFVSAQLEVEPLEITSAQATYPTAPTV